MRAALKRATNKAAESSGALKEAEAAAADGDVAAALKAAREASEAAAAASDEAAAALKAVKEIRRALNAKYVATRNARVVEENARQAASIPAEGELLPTEDEVLAEYEAGSGARGASNEATTTMAPAVAAEDAEGELLPSEAEVLAESGVTETSPDEESDSGARASSADDSAVLSSDAEGELLPSEAEVLAESGVTETTPEEESASSATDEDTAVLADDVEGELLPSDAEVLAESGVTETTPEDETAATTDDSAVLSADVEGELLPSEAEVLAESGVTETSPTEESTTTTDDNAVLSPDVEGELLPSEAEVLADAGAETTTAEGELLPSENDAIAVEETEEETTIPAAAKATETEVETEIDAEVEPEVPPIAPATSTLPHLAERQQKKVVSIYHPSAKTNAKPIVSAPKGDTYLSDASSAGEAAAKQLSKALEGSFNPIASRNAESKKALEQKKSAGTPLGADDSCGKRLQQWGQCGGKQGCPSGTCKDSAWEGTCCPYGWECVRSDAYYWQCKSSGGGGGGGSSGGGGNGGGGSSSGGSNPMPAPLPAVEAKLTASGDVDYAVPLKLSFLFLEAQRAGKLPGSQRVKWRGDSNTNAMTPWGTPIVRGYYDAGDGVLFNFPMAYALSTVGWSVFEFYDGYKKAGEYDNALAAVRWGSDYLLSCISPDGKEIVAQVGNGQQDHTSWGRPEDWQGARPVYTIKQGQKGADVAGAMSAALAAAAVAFKPVDAAYSAKCLSGAKALYEFALKSPGLYQDTVADAGNFYRSSNALDDVSFAAAMIAVAVGDSDKASAEKYANAAASLWDRWWKEEDGPRTWVAADWDSASWSAMTLLSTRLFPGNAAYAQRMNYLVDSWLTGGDVVVFTPKGLAWSTEWGSLRHTGNALFLMQVFSKYRGGEALANKVDCFSHAQLRYMLGFDQSPRSFVVGYGRNAPQRPHHRGSSCPPMPDQCSWDMYNNPGPNPQTLYGALVGGPGKDDSYKDDRGNYINNEVAMDYQAGFIGSLAAMASSPLKYNSGSCTRR
jgi:hypothetical protein